MIFFLKAQIPHAGTGDLIPASVPVEAHMQGGKYVSPYIASRRKRSSAPRAVIRGHHVEFPDEAHFRLYAAGERSVSGLPADPQEHAALWDHFRGYVEHDPATGHPFGAPEHVEALAHDYAGEVHELAASQTRKRRGGISAGSVVDPDRAEDYWRRAS